MIRIVLQVKYANPIKIDAQITPVNNPLNWCISATVWFPSVGSAHDKHFVNARGNPVEGKADVPPLRGKWNTRSNRRWYICFYTVCEMSTTSERVILLGGVGGQEIFCCRYCWIKYSNLWHKQLLQMSQYLLGNNIFSLKTTFVNETNTFYQHVDRSPGIWLRGPHKGSQAKLQYFSKQPLGFPLPIIIWMLIRSLICILMLCPCSI